MFFWRASVFLEAMRNYMPRTASVLASLPRLEDRRFHAELKHAYPLCQDLSVDYGIMEKAAVSGIVHGVPAGEIGWSDLGSWNAVYELFPRDEQANVLRSEVILHETRGCLVDAPGKLVALVGVNDMVVVDTPEALLIVHREHAQRVGELVKMLEKAGRTELL
jgi:mannose-1-phosphate guanylyltransferase